MSGNFYSHFAILIHRYGVATNPEGTQGLAHCLRFVQRPLFNFLRSFCVALCRIDIQENSILGRGIWLSPHGNIIIGAQRLGSCCVIHHNVTFGMRLAENDFTGTPFVGDDVWIGPNCLLCGNIRIGDGATVLGGTVYSRSIPKNCVVGGNPGRIIRKKFNNSNLRASTRWDFTPESIDDGDTLHVC